MSGTSTASLPQVAHTHPQEVDGRNRLAIGVLLASTFVVILNETIMSVALPHLMDDFDIEASAAQWLTTAFLLSMAVVIPITGFLLQRVSTRAIFISAMSLFSAGTLIAAIAPGFEILVGARVVQAMGTAIMIPLLFTTVLTLVPAERRGRVMGNISIVISVAPAVGPTVSGLILSALSWRWMFIIVLPVAVLALVVGVLHIPNVSEPRKTPLDYVSVVLSAIGFGGLVFGLSHIGETEAGISSPTSWAPLASGAAGIALFILRQLQLQRTDRALLDLRTFTSSGFTFAIAVIAIYTTILFGTLTLLPIYTQNVLELDALTTGLLMLPGGLVMGFLSPFVGRLYDKAGPTVLVVPGSIIVSGALWFMTTLGAGSSIVTVLVAHIVLSIGLALAFTPLFTSGLASLSPQFYSHGSATVSTVQQLAGAVGIAVFITVMTATSTPRIEDGASVIAATADGIHAAFLCGAILSLIAIPLAFFIREPASSGAPVPVGH